MKIKNLREGQNTSRLSTKLLPGGRLRTAHLTTRLGREIAQEEIEKQMRREIEFTRWSRSKIKATYTQEYIADLLQRAEANRQAIPRSELGEASR